MKTARVRPGLVLVAVIVSGCAESAPAYPASAQGGDRAECEAWAKQQTGYDPAAAIGGVVGAVGGAATGSTGRGASLGATVGGVGKAVGREVSKHAKSKEGFDRALASCMAARGYPVGGVTQAATTAPVAPPATTPPPAPVPTQDTPTQVQVAETTGTRMLSHTYRECKIEIEEVQVVSGEVEVILIYTCKSKYDVRYALTDPGKTRLVDNRGRVWPYKTSSGLNVITAKDSRGTQDTRWVTVPGGTDNRMTATLTFSPPDANAALASGTVFRLSSEQWYYNWNNSVTEAFTLVFRGLALPTPAQ